MPRKRPATLSQVIRSYGLHRVDNLLAGGYRLGMNPMMRALETFFPRATPATLRQLVDTYKQARKAATYGKQSNRDVQKQLTPLAGLQEKQWQYTARVTVKVLRGSQQETWLTTIVSSRQLTEDQIKEEIQQRITNWRENAIGRSRERLRDQLELVEYETRFVTRKR